MDRRLCQHRVLLRNRQSLWDGFVRRSSPTPHLNLLPFVMREAENNRVYGLWGFALRAQSGTPRPLQRSGEDEARSTHLSRNVNINSASETIASFTTQ